MKNEKMISLVTFRIETENERLNVELFKVIVESLTLPHERKYIQELTIGRGTYFHIAVIEHAVDAIRSKVDDLLNIDFEEMILY